LKSREQETKRVIFTPVGANQISCNNLCNGSLAEILSDGTVVCAAMGAPLKEIHGGVVGRFTQDPEVMRVCVTPHETQDKTSVK
jgi:hypothetical protein